MWCGLANDSTALIDAVYQRDPLIAFECLADAQYVEPELADKIINNFQVKLGTISDDEKDAVEKAFGTVAADTRPRGQAVFQFLEKTLDTSKETSERTVAANALSLTNLPDAAETLARYYSSHPEVRQTLVGMGDLAVPSLGDLAMKGSVNAFDDLMEIKTPEAAKVLLTLLWNKDTGLSQLAAWRLAALLPLPNVEDTLRVEDLRNYILTEEQKKVDSLQWIWEPFRYKELNDSNLPIIIDKIAAKLIEQSSIDSAPAAKEVQLDPRIVIPLCAVELRSEANWTQVQDTDKLSQPFAKVVDTIISEESAARVGQKNIAFTGDSESSVLEKVFNKLSIQSSTPQSTEKKVQFIEKFLESAEVSTLWRRLFDSLQPNIRLDLLRRLLNSYPSGNNWRNIFRRVEYELITSWHHKTLLTIFAIMSLVALIQIGLTVLNASPWISWTNGFIVAAALAVIMGWLGLFAQDDSDEMRNVISLLILGIIRAPILVIKDINYGWYKMENLPGDLVSIVWFPAVFYFTCILLLTFLSWQFVVFFWLILIVICSLLWWRGNKLYRDSRNPLQGIIEFKESET